MASHYRAVILLLVFVIFSGAQAWAQAWEAPNKWTVKTEDDYAEWFKKTATPKYFVDKDGLASRVGVDCGKAAYAFRAIFAQEKGLPFKVIGTNGKWIDAQTGTYRGSERQKLISFLYELVQNTSVESLKNNTFPIAIERGIVQSGVVYVFQMPGKEEEVAGRHTYMVKDIDRTGMIYFIFATVPAIPRPLSERKVLPFYIPLDVSIFNQWGFRRFYQPQDYETFSEIRAKIKSASKDSTVAENALLDVPNDLKQRGYDPLNQNKLAETVLRDYEDHVNFFKNGVKNPGFSPLYFAPVIPKQSVIEEILGLNPFVQKQLDWILYKKMTDPNFREHDVIKELTKISQAAQQRTYLDHVEARKKIIEEFNVLNPNQKKLNVSELVKSGTFISDPPNVPTHLSVSGLYGQQLINKFARNSVESLEDLLKRNFFNLCGYSLDRAQAVTEGNNYFFGRKIVSASNKFERCPTEEEIYDYTTGNRDSELTDFIGSVRRLYLSRKAQIKREFPNSWYLVYERILNDGRDFADNPELMKLAEKVILESKEAPGGESCEMEIKRGKKLSIWEAVKALQTKNVSSPVPWHNIEQRWGQVKLGQADIYAFNHYECENPDEKEKAEATVTATPVAVDSKATAKPPVNLNFEIKKK
jgi:hypothetical protein